MIQIVKLRSDVEEYQTVLVDIMGEPSVTDEKHVQSLRRTLSLSRSHEDPVGLVTYPHKVIQAWVTWTIDIVCLGQFTCTTLLAT